MSYFKGLFILCMYIEQTCDMFLLMLFFSIEFGSKVSSSVIEQI